MFKRFSTTYSLWPEQARRGTSLTPAAGGFAVGVVFAIAAYNVISNFVRPATVQEPAAQRVVGHVPIPAPALTPAVTPAPAQLRALHFAPRPPSSGKKRGVCNGFGKLTQVKSTKAAGGGPARLDAVGDAPVSKRQA